MRNHQQCDPEDATSANLGDATFNRTGKETWWDSRRSLLLATGDLTAYGATFWKPITPEPGYRLVEDHERVGEKPKGCRCSSSGGRWADALSDSAWEDNLTYAVPTKQVVAWAFGELPAPTTVYAAYFTKQEDRDRAVREANEREV